MTLVSVILPTHNRANYLARSMNSVLSQTHAELELIVVDDGSDDATAAVVASLLEKDDRVRYERLAHRSGVSAARNRGIQLASGAWIAFQDSDDEWQPGKLAAQLHAAGNRTDVALVVTNTSVINGYPKAARAPTPDGRVHDYTAHARIWVPGAPTWMSPRHALIAAGAFSTNLSCHEDWELALRLAQRGRVLLVNEELVICDRAPGSLFFDEISRVDNLRRILSRHRIYLSGDRRAWAYYCNALGQGVAQFGDIREARQWFTTALRASPLNFRSWLNLWMSLFGRTIFAKYVVAARRIRNR